MRVELDVAGVLHEEYETVLRLGQEVESGEELVEREYEVWLTHQRRFGCVTVAIRLGDLAMEDCLDEERLKHVVLDD